MTTQSSDHPNAYKYLDIENLKIYSRYMASFVEAKIASYVESKGERSPVQKVTLYRYRYPGGQMAFSRFPTKVRYCIIFSISGLEEIIPRIPDDEDFPKMQVYPSRTVLHGSRTCTVLNILKAILVPIDDLIKQKYDFISDVYNLKSHLDIADITKDNLLSENIKQMLREWMVVAIDDGNNEFADKCSFLDLDFQNIILYERSKNKPESLEKLLTEAVPEVAKIYNAYKLSRKNKIDDDEIKNSLRMYFNEHRSSFYLVKEKFLNNNFLYSSELNSLRRDFCGRLLSFIIAEYGYSRPGAQTLYARMQEIERANKEKDFT
jgi:hypothetical protein